MPENKNQTSGGNQNNLLVKDYDGRMKVLAGGELKELQDYLTESQSSAPAAETDQAIHRELAFPKFTDIAVTPADEHFREPEKRGAQAGTAPLQFHPDDQKEVVDELAKLSTIFKIAAPKRYSIEKIVRKLVEKHGLQLDAGAFKQLTSILLSGFRQARSFSLIRELLTSPKNSGGMGLSGQTVDHMLLIVKNLKEKIEGVDGMVVNETEQESSSPTPPGPRRPAPVQKPEMPAMPALRQAPLPRPQPPRPTIQAPIPAPAPRIEPVSELPKVARPAAREAAFADVRRAGRNRDQKLMGPIDELAAMDLPTWRLLDADPRIRAGKILGRIKSLETESLLRKSQGVDAWRKNEVYHLYLQIGQKSLEKKKEISGIIAGLEAAGTQTLTLQEFEAISDLNRALRF